MDQFTKIFPKRRLSARKSQLRDFSQPAVCDDLFPILGRKLPHLRLGLPRRIAMHALLIAMPCTVLFHGRDHKIHPMGRRHTGRILSDGKQPDLLRQFLVVDHILKDPHHGQKVFLQIILRNLRIDLSHIPIYGFHDPIHILRSHFPRPEGIDLLNKNRKQNRPGFI